MARDLIAAAAFLATVAWLCHRLDCANAAQAELHRLRALHGR